MFSLKKKKTKGIQGGAFPVSEPLPTEELVEPPFEYLEQHHKKTLHSQAHIQMPSTNVTPISVSIPSKGNTNLGKSSANLAKSATNIHLNDLSPPMHQFDCAQSGDESDNYHNQMEHLRSQFYTPDPQKRTKEYHLEQSTQAIELLKMAAKPDGWKKVDKHKSGCVVYQSTSAATIPGHGEHKYPAFKGEHVIRGFKAQDIFSIVSVRKLWDDWYDELSCIDTYNDTTTLMYMVMKGTLSAKTRDIAMVERIEFAKDGTIYAASCSVESSKIPAVTGKVRAIIFLAGWVIQPLPSNPPITKITYVIQTDLLSRLPKFIAKRSLIKRAMAITTVETYLRKNGPPTLTVAAAVKTANRHRSLSEPVKVDRLLLPPDSDDEEQNDSFLEPIKARRELRFMDESGDSTIEEPVVKRRVKQNGPGAARSPTTRNSLMVPNSTFGQEYTGSNSFMSDSDLFRDSSAFGKSGIIEGTHKKKEEPPALPTTPRPQPMHSKKLGSREKLPERLQEKSRPPLNLAKTTASETTDSRRATASKRISIPVVAPKSEARMKAYSGNNHSNSTNQLAVPESGSIGLITPNTPPLTPPASVDGKDGSSDSDTAQPSPEVKVVLRAPKNTPHPVDTSRPNSLAMASLAMKSPSAMMEATTRRHSTLLSRPSAFVPRHSNAMPIRGNPNVSLQSLCRPSGASGSMPTALKRHSTAPSLDSNRSFVTYTPVMVLPHRHSETARKALAMFKVLASSPEDRWRAISSENGFKSYSRIISGAGLPMLRGEGTITGGWTVEQINAVIESAGCRQVWDERFENMSIAETFNHNEYLFHITLRGIGSLTGRDLAGVTIIDRDPQTCALYNVSTSVLDPTIPEDPGRIRAMLELSGWSLRPTFDGQGNTVSVNVTFVIQVDIRGNLPSSVVKQMTSSMTMAVSRLNQFINKTGYPPFASHISGTRLLDTFDPKTGFYELCYKAAPGWTEVRIGRKVYKEGYDFFVKPDDPSVKVEMAPDFGGVRVWTTLDHEGQSIIAQVSRKGQNAIVEHETLEEEQEDDESNERGVVVKGSFKEGISRNSEVDADTKHSYNTSRKRRSASYTTTSTSSSARPESEASATSDRSRSRGRSSRSIVTLPAGAQPPPLPRRSSSLTRYSIPISAYLPEADAPPVPVNNTLTSGSLATPTTATSEVSSSTRPVSASLGSPTLGFFHDPVVPANGPAVAPEVSAPTETKPSVVATSESASSIDNVSAVLLESAPAAPESSKNSVSAAAAAPSIPLSSIASAMVATTAEVVSVATALDDLPASPKEGKAEDDVPSPTTTSPTTTFQPTSRLKNKISQASLGGAVRRRDVRVTFSLDTIDKSTSEDAAAKPLSPLDSIVKANSGAMMGASVPSLAKEHSVKVITVAGEHHYEHQAAIVEECLDSGDESDEAEFMEARDELSDDEMELALVLTGINSLQSLASSSSSSSSLLDSNEERLQLMTSPMRVVERGLTLITTSAPKEVKMAILFLLLAYYASRLLSLVA